MAFYVSMIKKKRTLKVILKCISINCNIYNMKPFFVKCIPANISTFTPENTKKPHAKIKYCTKYIRQKT